MTDRLLDSHALGDVPGDSRSTRHWRLTAWWRRGLFTVLVAAQTAVGARAMIGILPYRGHGVLELSLLVIYTVLFAWISAGMWMAVFGFVVRALGGDRHALLRRHAQTLNYAPLAPTAVVMPIYHEDVERSLRGLRATYRSLERTGQLHFFEFFILSDSRDPERWLAEQEAWQALCRELGAQGRLHYRRRRVNLKAKPGNISDFLRRWGRRFRYFVVLDADSLMRGDTLVRMVQLMEREPRCGILQTAPELVNAHSPYARLQQFSNHVYGPVFSAGLAALQLGEAVYWGHNAIIRTAPFMRHCALPRMRGIGLFRGPVLSHDFVEAAYMARAGYEVWLEPELGGSYEESPPSLDDELARDRRWAKGNLQHLRLLMGGRGLHLAHRLAFLNGILSYAAAPLWLAFLVLSTLEVAHFTLWPIDYFPGMHSLFPVWPRWNPGWAVLLSSSTAVILLLPKVLAVLDTALHRTRRRAYGGVFRLVAGALLETLTSAMLAPVRMLAHSRYVIAALLAIRVRWAGQNRSLELAWGAALLKHAPAAVLAFAWAGFGYWLKPMFFYWSMPVVVPLLLAAPTSVLLSRFGLGERLRRAGLWVIPQESSAREPMLAELDGKPLLASSMLGCGLFEMSVLHPQRNALAARLARSDRGARRVRLQALRERCLEQGPDALRADELQLLAGSRESMRWLHRSAWAAAPDNPWGARVEALSLALCSPSTSPHA
ncbi:glucans biosynthesis glucosyltransferase MdoH [Acidihalobacter ferrooxydans]|uniref:Glucans biosynthesis glucosyltransferase H n=1 Tax=Acidihalobacter ferrooxydans TaxID=1765967 RepID=A0A1P8UEN1_9GAMM|nr:glucans biosynthesis glucosyltransferase MdoH [Acidihalobacter ferrooxydans]APZ42312.1 glucan biosynthesis glucosyltransferase H [Acidihalobacter ferrooxydans]